MIIFNHMKMQLGMKMRVKLRIGSRVVVKSRVGIIPLDDGNELQSNSKKLNYKIIQILLMSFN